LTEGSITFRGWVVKDERGVNKAVLIFLFENYTQTCWK
jgi:hypothetical protein